MAMELNSMSFFGILSIAAYTHASRSTVGLEVCYILPRFEKNALSPLMVGGLALRRPFIYMW